MTHNREEINKILEQEVPTVLHVDDDEEFLVVFRMQFKKSLNVISVDSGEKALEELKNNRFDLVLTDYEMPGMNGIDLLKIIKKDYPFMPVIFYTGQGNENIAREAFLEGVSDYLIKGLGGFAHREKLLHSVNKAVERRKTEEALKESQEKYRAIVDAFEGLIYICSQDYRIEFMNEALIRRTGRNGTGEFCYNVLHHLEMVCPWCVNERVFKGETVRWEVQSPLDNRWYYVVNTPIYHSDGTMSKQALILDINDRKQSENRVNYLNKVLTAIRNVNQLIVMEKNRERLLQKICDSLVESRGYTGAWIVLMDTDGKFLTAGSSGMGSKFHCMVERLKNNDYPPCIQNALKFRENISLLEDTSNCGDCPLKGSYRMMSLLKHRDRLFGVLYVSIPDEMKEFALQEEEKSLFLEVAGDISYALFNLAMEESRRNSEKNLKLNELKYHTLFEASPDAVFLESIRGDILDCNSRACNMLGYTREEMLRLNVRDLLPPEIAQNIPDMIHQQLTTGGMFIEAYNKKKDGTIFPVMVSTRIIDIGGEKMVTVYVRDITATKQYSEYAMIFKSLFEQSGYQVAVLNMNGNILLSNSAWAMEHGYSTEETVGMPLTSFYDDEEKETEIDEKEPFYRPTERFPQWARRGKVVWHTRKDGTRFPALTDRFLITGEQEAVFGVVTAIGVNLPEPE